MMRAALLGLLLALLLPVAFGQDMTRTLSQRTQGERTLQLTGLFQGADTVLVQVYHDGEVLSDQVAVRTFSLTLGTFDYYVIKFTTADRRTKRVYILELSDDMVEFYPPIEVDFDRTGNLVLIKQSSGKPDWLEYDVGMSRKR